jgi:hypothetical protein
MSIVIVCPSASASSDFEITRAFGGFCVTRVRDGARIGKASTLKNAQAMLAEAVRAAR